MLVYFISLCCFCCCCCWWCSLSFSFPFFFSLWFGEYLSLLGGFILLLCVFRFLFYGVFVSFCFFCCFTGFFFPLWFICFFFVWSFFLMEIYTFAILISTLNLSQKAEKWYTYFFILHHIFPQLYSEFFLTNQYSISLILSSSESNLMVSTIFYGLNCNY